MPATDTQQQSQARRIGQHRAAVRERRRAEVTVDFPDCPDVQRLARYKAVLEAIARNDGLGARQLTGTIEHDTSIYRDEAGAVGGYDVVDLLGRAARRSAEVAIFARRLNAYIAREVAEFLAGEGR